MIKKLTPSSLIAGLVLGVSLAVGGVTMASGVDSIKFIVNGADKTPKDNIFNNNGSLVEASFIRNGTTYVPIRLVSNLLNVPISWIGTNRSILIGEQPTGISYLSDVDPYYSYLAMISNNDQNRRTNTGYFRPFSMKMADKDYVKGIAISTNARVHEFRVDYDLNGKFSSFSSFVGLDDSSNVYAVKLKVLGDDRSLWEGTVTPGDMPKEINVNTPGVLKLTFAITPTEDFAPTILDIVDPILKH